MPALRLGLDLAGLRMPLKQALLTAAELGVDAVEIDARGEVTPAISQTALRDVRKWLDDLNLRVAAVSFRTRRGYATEAELDRRVAATKAAMDLAYQLGASVVVNHVGRVPPPDSDAWRLMVDVLGDLARHGSRAGASLAAETGAESGEDLARLLDALPPGAIGVDLNPARLILGGYSPTEAVETLGDRVLHCHLNDARRSSFPGEGEAAPLGRGDADLPTLLGRLEERGYRGYYTLQLPGGADALQQASAAVSYLRRL